MLSGAPKAARALACLAAATAAAMMLAGPALAGGGGGWVTCQGTGCNLFAQAPGTSGHVAVPAAAHPAARAAGSSGPSMDCFIPATDGGLAGFVIPSCPVQTLNAALIGTQPVILPVVAVPGRVAPPAPVTLARAAESELNLPSPVIRSSPAAGALQLTQLPVWLWMTGPGWQPQVRTAAVPGEAVTATAAPVAAAWQMGDGSTVTCHGPGTPYTAGDDPAAPSPTCGHTYTQSSAGQPEGAYPVRVTIDWDITWRGTGGAAGALPPLFTVATAGMRVAQSQALNTAGGQ